jgi:hypothetical protein
MINRRVVGLVCALAVALSIPAQAHAQPPTQCLTSTPKGKQIYLPCDLVNARVNYPPGQRCQGLGPLDAYPKDTRDWCG